MCIRKTVLTLIIVCAAVFAGSSQIGLKDVFDGKLAAKDFDGTMIEGGFSCHNDIVHYWNASTGYSTLDAKTGQITNIGKPDNMQSNGFGDPFGVYDPQANCFYVATCAGMSDGYLYKYDYAADVWTEEGTAVNFYGGAIYNSELYFTGLTEPWDGGTGQTTFISRFVPGSIHTNGDLQLHDAIVETAGNSADLAIDKYGNVYYANYNGQTPSLYRWTNQQVQSVIDDINGGEADEYLTLADGEKLTNLPGGANGIAADDDGNVFVTVNMSAYLLMWNGVSGDGDNYVVIGEPFSEWGWMGPLAIEGSFMDGAVLYGAYNFYSLITAIALPGCLERPSMDVTGDCIVSIDDFAMFASQWLADGTGYKLEM